MNHTAETTLVLGGNGKTGRRVVEQLEARGLPVRIGSRSGSPSFDWNDASNWEAVVDGVAAIYIAYHPDLAVPGATENIERLVKIARAKGVGRLVLLSGRGEPEAQACEEIVLNSGIPSTVVRCGWFNQNFTESFLHQPVIDGVIALPDVDVREPFVDADDIADVAVAALTEDGHDGEVYELTGPELLSFADIAADLSRATGMDIRYQPMPHETYIEALKATGIPGEFVWLIDYLFGTILDGRNEALADGVQRALGREPRSFADFARKAAAAGAWDLPVTADA